MRMIVGRVGREGRVTRGGTKLGMGRSECVPRAR